MVRIDQFFIVTAYSLKMVSLVKSARNLPLRKGRPPKAYVQIATGRSTARTKTASRGETAEWNESLTLYVAGDNLVRVLT